MRILFVYWAFEDQGSGLLIQGYTQAARDMGHEVAVYGKGSASIPLNYTLDVGSADAVLFIFEWTTALLEGDILDLIRLMSRVPRSRRVILDGDGNYNRILRVDNDYNHRDEAARRQWIDICDSLSDKICQPTFHALEHNVKTFLFYCYNPAWEVPLSSNHKEFGLLYVGNSKFRWEGIETVLRAAEPIRNKLGRIALVGHGWAGMPPWAKAMQMEEAYYVNRTYLDRLRVEALPPVPFREVVAWMSKGVLNPVLSRPTFNQMRFVTPRYFETPASNTIPIFGVDSAHVREIYGERALELVLPEEVPEEKLLDMLERPDYYSEVVRDVRGHLTSRHSQKIRLKELIEIIEN